MKYRHYAPKGQLTLVEGDRDKVIARINELVKEKEEEGHKVGVIGTDETFRFLSCRYFKKYRKSAETRNCCGESLPYSSGI